MSTHKLGRIFIISGVIVILASVLVDWIGVGDQTIGSSQLAGIMVGIFVAVTGFSLAFLAVDKAVDWRAGLRSALNRLLDMPVSIWVVMGFLGIFILFFVAPMFLNTDWSMRYFVKYLPDRRPIGLDLRTTMGVVTPWVQTRESPYPDLFYPPLTYILFAPLSLLNYPASYVLITFLTLFSFCALAALAALLLAPGRDRSIIMLFFVSGLVSYGFQFELERGQFNVITFFLCALAVYIFHRYYEFRYLAYLLFSAAIHIKLYPAIFILTFVRDWRDWKSNLKRWFGLGAFNFALLFALGYREFLGFVDTVMIQIRTPSWTWNGNHSLQAFIFNFMRDGYGLVSPATLAALQRNSGTITYILLGIILACIFAVVIRAYLLKENGFNPYIFGVCTLGALIIPTSNDYTLPILAAPLALFLSSLPPIRGFRAKVPAILLILTISAAYASILLPFKYKPYFMNNSFLPLLLILIAGTALYFLKDTPSNSQVVDLSSKAN
ncbi:MAG: glycosyltransferase family 87 protein [Chloroflexota bacterium]|nr:DUF2029 domain-containing protein [Chloroflexota bacterium]MBI5704809.1 DUF2029 domain-containing protein [Chloroflexota bacterium]